MQRPFYLVLVLSVVLTASCTTAPILNIENALLPTRADGSRPTKAEVKTAILSACNARGWAANVEADGVIVAQVLVRTHTAVVEIPYDDAGFSILYRDSENLAHSGRYIHRNYNRWVLLLYAQVMRNLGSRAQKF